MTEAKVVITAEDRASAALRSLRGNVDTAVAAFSRLSAAGAALGAGALIGGLRSLVGEIDDLDEAAQGVGLTAVQLANLRQAAGEAGVGAEALDGALTRLNVRVGDAVSGNAEAVRLFGALGVSFKTASGEARPANDVLREVAAVFAQLPDGASKSALAVELFGKSGAKLVPLLNQGADGLERFSGLTDETVREAARLQSEVDKLTATWQRLKFELASGVVPVLNDTIGVFRQLDFRRIFTAGTPGQIVQEYARQVESLAGKQLQLREALKLGEGAYSNEGRAALRSAEAILANARAKEENTRANKRNKDSSLGGVFDAEFRDAQRIRANRQRLQEEVDEDNRRAQQERAQRVDDLFGRSEARRLAEDVALLDEEFFSGRVTVGDYDAALERVFGRQSQDRIKQTKDAAEQVSLVFASSIGSFIESGGRGGVRSFFDALTQDLVKLTTQLLITQPLAQLLKDTLSSGSSGGGGGGSLFGAFASAIGSYFGGARANGGPVSAGRAYLVGERGPEMIMPRSAGTVVPNGALAGMGANITINLPAGAEVTRSSASQIAAEVARTLATANRRFN